MIGFTSKINSLGTNESLFYFSFNCKFKSLKWIWQITRIAEECCGRKARFPKILENPRNTGNKSQIQLVEPCVSVRTLLPCPLKKRKESITDLLSCCLFATLQGCGLTRANCSYLARGGWAGRGSHWAQETASAAPPWLSWGLPKCTAGLPASEWTLDRSHIYFLLFYKQSQPWIFDPSFSHFDGLAFGLLNLSRFR